MLRLRWSKEIAKFGRQVSGRRGRLQLHRERFAEIAGLPVSVVRNAEAGRCLPPLVRVRLMEVIERELALQEGSAADAMRWGAQLVRPARIARGWTQAHLGEIVGCSASIISRLELGKGGTIPQIVPRLIMVLALPAFQPAALYVAVDGLPADRCALVVKRALREFARRRRDPRFASKIGSADREERTAADVQIAHELERRLKPAD